MTPSPAAASNSGGSSEPSLDELYREVIVEHYRAPRNYHALTSANARAEGANVVCGDEVRVELRLEGPTIAEAAFTGIGCAISQASASLMTEAVTGLTTQTVLPLIRSFETMLRTGLQPGPELGDLEALQGVARFPVRVKCAVLPWKVLREALDDYAEAPGGG